MENNIQFRAEQQQIRALPWVLANLVLNAFFVLWTFGGSVFLFFLDELGLPKGQIGAVLALFPFCGILALWFAPMAARWGWKRVFLVGYVGRTLVMALLLLLPWVLARGGSTAFLPLYVKERLGVASGTVVMLDIVVMVGGALAGLLLGWAADRVGSRPVLMPAAAMTLLVPLGWLLLPRQTSQAVAWCAALYFLNGVAASGVAIAAGRLLFNSVIPPDKSTAYTAIYYAWLGITGGLAPLLAGALLTTCGDWQTRVGVVVVDGHGLLFLGAILLLAAGWWLYGRVRPDDRHTTRSVLSELLVPSLRHRLLQIWR